MSASVAGQTPGESMEEMGSVASSGELDGVISRRSCFTKLQAVIRMLGNS